MSDSESHQPSGPAAHRRVTPERASAPRQTGFRWEAGLAIASVGIVTELAVWNWIARDGTYQVLWTIPVISGTACALLVWWFFFSNIDWQARLYGLYGLVSCIGLFILTFRFEGYEGDMWPQFRLRFTPSAEEQLQTFLTTEETGAPVDSPLERRATDWPCFRGPERTGIAFVDPDEFDWTRQPEEVWRRPVGRGWSSFSIVSGRAFTQEQRGEMECVVCYDMADGQQLWVHEDKERFEETLGGPGPRATPAFHDNRLYSLGATGVLNCLSASDGQLLWQQNVLHEANAKNIPWAMSGSPLVTGNLVIVNPGGSHGKALIAFDRVDGQTVWAVANDSASYSAPSLRTLLGQQQIVIFDGEGIKGHMPESGEELWRIPWTNSPKINAAEPIQLSENQLLVGSGYGRGSGLFELSRQDGLWQTKAIWAAPYFKLKFNSAVQKGRFAFGLDEGILSCLNADTGKLKWKRGRYGYGQLLLAGNTLVVQTENGDIAFVEADSDRFNELQRFPALHGKTWNHPVIWDGMLLVRNGEEAACFRLPAL